jgi:hypothetical protein
MDKKVSPGAAGRRRWTQKSRQILAQKRFFPDAYNFVCITPVRGPPGNHDFNIP